MTLDEIRTRLEALGVQVGSTFLAKTGAGVLLAVQIGAEPEQWDALLAGPALTPAEVSAIQWAIKKAEQVSPQVANWADIANALQGLLDRMGAVSSPSTPETGEES